MRINQLAAVASSGESDTLEFTKTTGARREAATKVGAFLNRGGRRQVSERIIEELSP